MREEQRVLRGSVYHGFTVHEFRVPVQSHGRAPARSTRTLLIADGFTYTATQPRSNVNASDGR